eukprot:m.669945 g.669945  ORF g.669945 m.669945 type:complete len:337 (-) comp58525_c2_seq2:29-1039(-)
MHMPNSSVVRHHAQPPWTHCSRPGRRALFLLLRDLFTALPPRPTLPRRAIRILTPCPCTTSCLSSNTPACRSSRPSRARSCLPSRLGPWRRFRHPWMLPLWVCTWLQCSRWRTQPPGPTRRWSRPCRRCLLSLVQRSSSITYSLASTCPCSRPWPWISEFDPGILLSDFRIVHPRLEAAHRCLEIKKFQTSNLPPLMKTPALYFAPRLLSSCIVSSESLTDLEPTWLWLLAADQSHESACRLGVRATICRPGIACSASHGPPSSSLSLSQQSFLGLASLPIPENTNEQPEPPASSPASSLTQASSCCSRPAFYPVARNKHVLLFIALEMVRIVRCM